MTQNIDLSHDIHFFLDVPVCLFYRLFAVDPSSRQLVFTVNDLRLGKLAHGMLKLKYLTFYAVDLTKGCHICIKRI